MGGLLKSTVKGANLAGVLHEYSGTQRLGKDAAGCDWAKRLGRNAGGHCLGGCSALNQARAEQSLEHGRRVLQKWNGVGRERIDGNGNIPVARAVTGAREITPAGPECGDADSASTDRIV